MGQNKPHRVVPLLVSPQVHLHRLKLLLAKLLSLVIGHLGDMSSLLSKSLEALNDTHHLLTKEGKVQVWISPPDRVENLLPSYIDIGVLDGSILFNFVEGF